MILGAQFQVAWTTMNFHNRFKVICILAALGLLWFGPVRAAETIEKAKPEDAKLLKEVFPQADFFSVKAGKYPHNKAFKAAPQGGESTLLGFVFMTNEVEPDEWGYAGPIEILVGLTTDGVITAVKVVYHREPFGSFSIATPEFAAQFKGKKILDAFEVGRDIDGVTRATISVDGATRVIKKSTRHILRQYLAEEQSKK